MSANTKKALPKALSIRLKAIGVLFVALAIFFLPTTILLLIGLMPTIAAAVVDNSKGKSLTLSVGILNLAGCFPFVVDLWQSTNPKDIQEAIKIAIDVRTIIVIYLAAALGYVIDYLTTSIVSNLMLQKASSRIKKIAKIQNEMIDRWGLKVNGKIPLDEEGFPVQRDQD